MSKDISVPLAEACQLYDPEHLMPYIAHVLRQEPTPEFLKWLAVQIEEGRIIPAPAGRGRPTDSFGEAEIMNEISVDPTFDRSVKMDAMIATLKERHPVLGRDKARDLIKAGLDQREESEAVQRRD